MADKKRVYWDACTWIGLINEEPGRVEACRYVIEQAELGYVEIWTSTFTLAEVFKKKCGSAQSANGLGAANDIAFEEYLKKDFVVRVQVDDEIGTEARRLLRKHSKLKKPQDAIHLATAVIHNIDEMHTFDGDNLTALDGHIIKQDGTILSIGPPAVPAPVPQPPSLFDRPK